MGEGGCTSHKDGGATRVSRDEEAVERIVQTITNLVDPFRQDEVITPSMILAETFTQDICIIYYKDTEHWPCTH